MHHSYFDPYLKIKMFLILGQVFIYIVAFVGIRLAVQMDWLNTKGSDLKPYFMNLGLIMCGFVFRNKLITPL
jgi:hypothetical protein